MENTANLEILGLAEWDWVTDGKSILLHHLASSDDPEGFEQDCGSSGVSTCGRKAQWWCIPGIFTRMGAKRCPKCCKATGLPVGVGSPKNDTACREILEARGV